MIPLDAIIGSVGRYTEFTRSYWPLSQTDDQRWAKVKLAVSDLAGVPPIEVYQIGEAYFVQDGNHRVSVFREMGATHIQAHVTQLATRVPLSPGDDIDDVIIKAEYLEFLENTQLDKLRPHARIELSVPGAYKHLEQHIRTYQHYLSRQQHRQVSLPEAVMAWFDHYYRVVINTIERLSIQRDFPGCTAGDIYMMVWDHRGTLMEKTSIDVSVDLATQDLAKQRGVSLKRWVSRLWARLRTSLLPRQFLDGPPPGAWRAQTTSMQHRKDCLFGYVLVSMGSEQSRKKGLEQALIIARGERSTLYGLHVLPSGFNKKNLAGNEAHAFFEERCQQEGVEGYFSFAQGKISRQIIDRARWTDLIVTTLAHPPGKKRLARFGPGFDALVRASPTPILAVPGLPSHFRRALVAYDGSPKAREALFVAAYLAHRWRTQLVVLTVNENGKPTAEELDDMRSYLANHEIDFTFIGATPPVPQAILNTAHTLNCDLILMGGYGKTPVLEILLGSTVDEVLRLSQIPILVCR